MYLQIYYEPNDTLEEDEMKENKTIQRNKSNSSCFDIENYKTCLLHDPYTLDIYYGLVENRSTVYPIYENCSEYVDTLWQYDTDLDGVVLENAWPLDESKKEFDDIYKKLPYFNQV